VRIAPPCLIVHLPPLVVVGRSGVYIERARNHTWCLRAESSTARPVVVRRRGRNAVKPPRVVVSPPMCPILGKFTSLLSALLSCACSSVYLETWAGDLSFRAHRLWRRRAAWASSQPPQQPVKTSPIAPPWASNAIARVRFVNGGVDDGIDCHR
jgi:hypothetical protein